MTRLRRPCAETVALATISAHEPDEGGPQRAFLRVVRGEPSDVELAALTAVVAAAAAGGGDAPARPVDHWSSPVTTHRTALHPGPGAWERTYLPR